MSRTDPALRMAARAMVETDRLFGLPEVPGAEPGPEHAIGDAGRSRGSELSETTSHAASPVKTAPVVSSGSTILVPAIDPMSLGDDVVTRLKGIEAAHAEGCPHCTTSTTHRSMVFGDGDPTAPVMFVGEAPGAEEDRVGRPFVGPAGELLDRMIDSVGLSRDGVYIANVVKVRPPENRTPRPDECESCGPWLLAQIVAIRPRVVVSLGATPTKYLLQTSTGITRLRGCPAQITIGSFSVPVVPTFHPAYVLRQYTAEVRRAVWEDLKQAVAIASE